MERSAEVPMEESLCRAEEVLARSRVRLTRTRRILLQVVVGLGRFTATELERAAARASPKVGRASVYRMLSLLEAHGLVERLRQGSSERYSFCLRPEHHHHVICTRCGRTDGFLPEGGILAALDAAAWALDYEPCGHVVEVYGVCRHCREAAPKAG